MLQTKLIQSHYETCLNRQMKMKHYKWPTAYSLHDNWPWFTISYTSKQCSMAIVLYHTLCAIYLQIEVYHHSAAASFYAKWNSVVKVQRYIFTLVHLFNYESHKFPVRLPKDSMLVYSTFCSREQLRISIDFSQHRAHEKTMCAGPYCRLGLLKRKDIFKTWGQIFISFHHCGKF